MGPRQRQLPAELRRRRWCAAAHFTAADNETTAPVAVVNEAFVKRFFKSDEDPLDQHFGLDLPRERRHLPHRRRRARREVRRLRPEQAGAADVLRAAGADRRLHATTLMQRIELQSHFIGGMMLVDATCRPARSSRC